MKEQKNGLPKKKMSKRRKGKKAQQANIWNIFTIGILALMAFTILYGYRDTEVTEETTLTKVADAIHAGDVRELVVRGDIVEVRHKDGDVPIGIAKKEGYAK